MERGKAMLKVVADVYEEGKDVIESGGSSRLLFWRRRRKWVLFEHAKAALEGDGVEGLKRYYDRCLDLSSSRARWVKETLERHGRKTLESELPRFLAAYRSGSN